MNNSDMSIRKSILVEDNNIFSFDLDAHRSLMAAKPWTYNPCWFEECKISALALTKMVEHCFSGGHKEVMGILIGRPAKPNLMIVIDCFPLPVEGTETRVNPQEEAYEYMAVYLENLKKVDRLENAVGWYHSHPGYRCWLSGIDVSTQMTSQQFQDPWIAIVVDPLESAATNTVDIGVFRTFPVNHEGAEDQTIDVIPADKLTDYGIHCNKYYRLNVSYFASANDIKILNVLSAKHWPKALCANIEVDTQCEVIANYVTAKVRGLSEQLNKPSLSQSDRVRGSIDRSLKTLSGEAKDLSYEVERMVNTVEIRKSLFKSTESDTLHFD